MELYNILQNIAIAILAVWFIHITPVIDIAKVIIKINYGYTGRIKPFDCVGCLSFWVALIYNCFHHNIIISMMIAGVVSYFAILFEQLFIILIHHD